jgi:hypothetical protein
MQVHPMSLKQMYISWDTPGEMFVVFRSTSPTSGFKEIASGVKQPFYIDETTNMYDILPYYYKVEGYVNGAKISEDGPATLAYNEIDRIAAKVIHEARVALRMMNNPPVYFLLKRRAEIPNPENWNPITGRPRYDEAETKVQGYHDAIATRVSQDVSQMLMASSEEDAEKIRLSPIRAWILNFPLVYPEDVMVDVNNQRYKIISVARRTKSQFVIRQILELAPLDKGHPAYDIEVDRTVVPI